MKNLKKLNEGRMRTFLIVYFIFLGIIYLFTLSFKYNTKDLQNNERFVLFLESVKNNKLTYKQLIAN